MKKLRIHQIDYKLKKVKVLKKVIPPRLGWIYGLRTAMNMSLKQLGKRLGITAQGVKEIQERENNKSITINGLQKVAEALNMKLVYAIVPKEKSLEELINKRIDTVAKDIVQRTSTTMELEDQKTDSQDLKRTLKQEVQELKRKLPKYIWD